MIPSQRCSRTVNINLESEKTNQQWLLVRTVGQRLPLEGHGGTTSLRENILDLNSGSYVNICLPKLVKLKMSPFFLYKIYFNKVD